MALNSTQKEKLRELELERGGVVFTSQRSKAKSNPTIVISLGGLGGKTLNMLKGKFLKEIDTSDHVYFRMIDICEYDMNSLCTTDTDGMPNNNITANVERSEMIELYDPLMAGRLFDPIPTEITRWLNPKLRERVIDNTGAQQNRQIGRVILTAAYEYIRKELEGVIFDALKKKKEFDNVDVIILAGISGGTGGGMIIDIPYMIHDIFASNHCDDYRIAGYLYTPDVQFRVPGLAGNVAIQSNMRRNGYAALKEIDYFMNLKETGNTYRFQANSIREVVSNQNIFHNCVLISGYSANGGLNELSDIMGRLTNQLLDMLTDIQLLEGGVSKQMSNSIMSNEREVTETWFNFNQDRRKYHRYASYKYQVLGHCSIKIPKKEILAYCVNKIYEGVLNQLTDVHMVNDDMSRKIYHKAHMNNEGTLLYYALEINPQAQISREIQVGPYTKSHIKSDIEIAFHDARGKARSEAYKINEDFSNILENDLFDCLKNQVDDIFNEYGPYAAWKMITYKANDLSVDDTGTAFSGILEWLDILINIYINRENIERKSYAESGKDEICAAADAVMKSVFPSLEKIDEYIMICCEEAVSLEINAVLYHKIVQVLRNVRKRIMQYNNDVFEGYVNVLTEVQNILNKDGQYFTDGVWDENNNTCCIDLFKNGQADLQKLQAYLDDFISHVSIKTLANRFVNVMKNNKEKWLVSQNNFDPVSEVRTLMEECLIEAGIMSDITEKFVTVAYSPKYLTFAEVNEIWDDDTPNSPKMQALHMAANTIYSMLRKNAQPMVLLKENMCLSTFTPSTFISTAKDTPKLSFLLKDIVSKDMNFYPTVGNLDDRFTFRQQYMYLPLYALAGMKEANDSYCNSDGVGTHLDEREQNWRRVQNPYTIDAVAMDLAMQGKPMEEIKHYQDYDILMKVKALVKDGSEKYHFIRTGIDTHGNSQMTMWDIVKKAEDMEEFKKNLAMAFRYDPDMDMIQFMLNNGFVINPVNVEKGVTDVDLQLLDFADATPEDMLLKYNNVPVPVEDVYKWIRKSMKYMDILEKDTAIFEEIYGC